MLDILTYTLAKRYTDKSFSSLQELIGVYKYKGSVEIFEDLPKNPTAGDVYNIIQENGLNYAWTGDHWDSLGSTLNATPTVKVDELSILKDNDTLSLAGFFAAAPSTIPVKQADGSLSWVLYQDTEDLKSIIGAMPENGLTLVEMIGQAATAIKVGDEIIAAENQIIEIPLATAEKYGLVKSGGDINVLEDGTMEIVNININKITQTEGEELILASGNANF